MSLPDGWKLPPQHPYTYSDSAIVWERRGWRTVVMVGYPREKTSEKTVVIEKQRKTKEGCWISEGGKFNIKSEDDWQNIKATVEKLWPELGSSTTSAQIDAVVAHALEGKKLLDLVAQNPQLLESLPKDADLLSMPDEAKNALKNLLQASESVTMELVKKLSEQSIRDIEDFVKLLGEIRLATYNALITSITTKIAFIDKFAQVVIDDSSYERRGSESVHNLIAANQWIIDPSFVILHSDETLNQIIEKLGGEKINGADGKKRPDFLCLIERDSDEHIKKLVIIEIKRPGIKINLEHVHQVLRYKELIETHSGGGTIPQFEAYILGSEIDSTLKSNPLDKSGIHAKTYTDFVSKSRKFYEEYYKIVKDNPNSV